MRSVEQSLRLDWAISFLFSVAKPNSRMPAMMTPEMHVNVTDPFWHTKAAL
jgi:hypothetical protein